MVQKESFGKNRSRDSKPEYVAKEHWGKYTNFDRIFRAPVLYLLLPVVILLVTGLFERAADLVNFILGEQTFNQYHILGITAVVLWQFVVCWTIWSPSIEKFKKTKKFEYRFYNDIMEKAPSKSKKLPVFYRVLTALVNLIPTVIIIGLVIEHPKTVLIFVLAVVFALVSYFLVRFLIHYVLPYLISIPVTFVVSLPILIKAFFILMAAVFSLLVYAISGAFKWIVCFVRIIKALVLAIFTLIGRRSLKGFEKVGELFKNTKDNLSSQFEKISKKFKYNPLDKIEAIFTGIKNFISKVTNKASNQFAYGGAALACAFGIYEITQLCNITTDSYVDFLIGYVGFTFGITFGKIVFNIVRAIIERKAPEEPRVINARAVQGFVFSKYFPDPVSFRVPDNCPRWLKKILLWGPHHYNYRTIVLVSAKGRADDMKLECIEKPKEFEEYINSKQAQPKEVAFYTANQE